jgi:hypothetical protein
MRLLLFFAAGLCAFALCHYLWIPSIERRLRSESFTSSMRHGAVLSLAGVVRGVLLVNALTLAALILVVTVLRTVGGTTQANTMSAVGTIQQWRVWLAAFGPLWGVGVLIVTAGVLGLYAALKGRSRLRPAFERAFEQELKRLEREREEGELEDLPPTREMERVQSRIVKLERELVKLNWGGSTEPGGVTRQKLTDQLQLLTEQYDRLDVRRRTRLTLPTEEVEPPAPRTLTERVQVFLLSRSLLAALGKGSVVLFLASLLLLFPSLIGIYSPATKGMLDVRLVELHDLRARLDAEEWEGSRARRGPPTNELSEGDKQLLGEVARAFEEAAPAPTPPAPTLKHWYMMYSAAVRQEVLGRVVSRSQTPLEQAGSGSKIEGLDDGERQAVALFEGVVNSRGPSTQVGKEIYLRLEDAAKRSPSLMEKIRGEASHVLSPTSASALRRATFTRMMEGLTATGPGEPGTLARVLAPGVNAPLYNLAQQERARSFIAGIIYGGGPTDWLRNVGTAGSPRAPGGPFDFNEYRSPTDSPAEELFVDRISVKLSEYPPSVEAPPEKDVDIKTASAKVAELIQNAKGPDRESKIATYADALAVYSDYFPGQLGADTQTDRRRATTSPETRLPDVAVMDGLQAADGVGGSRGTFARARDFKSLRGFSRIGGVLIGRAPSDLETAALGCTDLEWEVEGHTIRLILTTADGRRFRSRPHPMALVYQAINYAADGRPVAATMVDATPLSELKVLLHPTLVDTPLGQRMIELDTFVTSSMPNTGNQMDTAGDRVEAQNELYTHAWAYRLLAALSQGGLDSEWDSYLHGILDDQEHQKSVQKALDKADLLSDPTQSPLTVKKEFFDPTLVELILKNARKGLTPEQFGQAIKDQALAQYRQASSTDSNGQAGSTNPKLQELLERWQKAVPGFRSWTGVREKEFTSDPASFMVLDGASDPMPFDFMYQVAFTSQPEFAQNLRTGSYGDAQPWEYPSLKEYIQKTVLDDVAKDKGGRERTVLKDAGEFAILQRMFRMAFNGQLGVNFPVGKLVALSEVASAGAPKTLNRTLRWHDFNQSRNSNDDELTSRLVKDIRLALGLSKDEEEYKRVYKAPLPALDR